jgi:hypothetical protein
MRRRRFVKLLAAGAAAILSQPVEKTLAAPARRARTSSAPGHPLPPAIEKEITAQKKSVADTLRVVRAYRLPAGSPPASVFRAERRSVPRGR